MNRAPQPAESAYIRILLAEDDLEIGRLINEALIRATAMQVQFTQVTHLSEAVQRLNEERFDVLLLDLTLPDSGGLGTFTRAIAMARQVPIIVLADEHEQEVAVEAVRGGAQDYLLKSQINEELLSRSVIHGIDRHHMLQELLEKAQELQAYETRLREIITKNPDGIVVVNQEGMVLFVNPAAESLFGRGAEELVDELFGFPTVAGEMTELDIISKEGPPRTAEMRVVESKWDGEDAYLASLRDVTDRMRAAEQGRKSQTHFLFRSMFRSLGHGQSDVLYTAGADAGAITFDFLKETWKPGTDEEIAGAMEEYFRLTCLFKLRDLRIDRGTSTVTARVQNSTEAESKVKTGGPVCFFLRGLFCGMAKRLLKVTELVCEESACQASGDEACEFVVHLSEKSG